MEVILVQLSDEGGKVGMLEHAGQDGLRELVHVLDDEAVAMRAPRDDGLERRVFEHPVQRENGNRERSATRGGCAGTYL